MSRADEIQVELLRRRSPEERLALAFALAWGVTANVIALAQRAIERRVDGTERDETFFV